MKMIISPAKSLNFEKELPTSEATQPVFLSEAERINKLLKKKSVTGLGKLMGISENLSQLNWERNQAFQLPFTPENARPAVYTFDGDVYTGLDAYSLPIAKTAVLQNQLRILSGLYGVLKPLDLIQAYRLEMGTKFSVGVKKNLPDFWKTKVTQTLNDELEANEFLVNLASNEYFSVIDSSLIDNKIITPQFKDFKNGKLKIISFYAKKARGLMTRFLIDNDIQSSSDIENFNSSGYTFSQAETADSTSPVFVR